MNGSSSHSSQPNQFPHPIPEEETNPFYQERPQPPPLYPPMEETNPFHQQPAAPPSSTNSQPNSNLYPQVNTTSTPDEIDTNPFAEKPTPSKDLRPAPVRAPTPPTEAAPAPSAPQLAATPSHGCPSSSSSTSPPQPPPCDLEGAEKWGTHVMGIPAVPTVHPDNKKAAFWGATSGDQAQSHSQHHPFLQYEPIERSSASRRENILNTFNSWSHKAENLANNIWHNLKTGPSVKEAAWGKVNLRAKTITGGGFEALYKQSFTTYPNEVLKKTFACYLSTSTGPVAGTLYLSNIHAAFCSDRPLSFTAPSGQISWSYYKVMVPLGKICTVNPVVMRENQSERYIQIVTVEGHDFWFMGFVNFEKASRHLTEGISGFIAPGVAVGVNPSAT